MNPRRLWVIERFSDRLGWKPCGYFPNRKWARAAAWEARRQYGSKMRVVAYIPELLKHRYG